MIGQQFIFLLLLSSMVALSLANKGKLVMSPCANGAVKTQEQVEADLLSWKDCPWQRADVINWTKRGFDLNGDGGIDEDECNEARNYYFKPAERIWGESCGAVMDHCDCDGDGLIDETDFLSSGMTCIRNCAKAKEVWYFLGSRILNGKPFSGVAKADESFKPDKIQD